MARPTLTWAFVQAWAKDNKVDDSALMQDDDGRWITGVDYDPGWSSATVMREYGADAITWGQFKALMDGASGEQLMRFTDARILDLGDVAEDGQPYFILQRRWG